MLPKVVRDKDFLPFLYIMRAISFTTFYALFFLYYCIKKILTYVRDFLHFKSKTLED